MEDGHIFYANLNSDIHLFAIFDGHGGNEVALFCQDHFAKALAASQNFKNQKYKEALEETFMKMDEMMLENDRKLLGDMFDSPELIASGATALVLLLTPKQIYLANSGDSRCFL